MPMVPNDLKDAIQSAMITEAPEDAISAQKVFGDTLQEYLQDNCEISYGWVGVSPPPASTPDPVTTFIATPTWIAFPLLPVPSFDLWILSLSTIIQTSLLIPEDNTFLLQPLTFGIVPIVGVPSGLSDPDDAMLDICTQIIDGIKLMINIIPATGTHGVYTGTASMVSIL